jgi:PAS domain S-box-containing protein
MIRMVRRYPRPISNRKAAIRSSAKISGTGADLAKLVIKMNNTTPAPTGAPRRWRAFSVTFALTLLLVGVIWIATLERVRFEHDQAVSAELAKNDDLALAHEERTMRSVEVFDNALRTVRHLHLHGGLPRDLRPLLTASGLDARYYTVFSVIGADGEVQASNAPDLKQNFSDRGYFREHLKDPADKLLIGPPILGRLTGRWIVTLTRRIEGPAGTFGGVMFVAMDPAFLATTNDQTSQGPDGVTALVGLDGIARARRSGNAVSFGDDVSKSQLFEALRTAGVGNYVAPASVDGVLRATSYRRLNNYPLITVVSSAMSDVLAKTHERDRAIYGAAAFGSLLTLALGLSTAIMLRRSMRAVDEAEAGKQVYMQLNHALNESESRANRIVESTPSAMIVVEADGTIIRANTRAETLFGYGAGEMGGLMVDRLVPERVRDRHVVHRHGFLSNGSTRPMGQGIDLYACRKDGSLFPVEIGLAPLTTGELRQTIASIVDITQRQAMQAELTQHRNRLEEQVAARTVELVNSRNEAERLAQVKAQFLANMSHEIRTPLNAIGGMAHLIRRQGLSDKQARQMDSLERASAHLLSVINSILELSKIDAGALHLAHEPVSVTSLVHEVIDLQRQHAIDKHIGLSTELALQPQAWVGDPTRLRQALLNYVSNAIKFTASGTVVIRVSLAAEDASSSLIRFEVQDTGIGVSPDALPRLFKAFEQADNSHTRQYGGTGLGLAITRMVAHQMGGDTGATSRPGEGSTFWFTARLAKASADPVAADAWDQQPSMGLLTERHARAAVLLVDDEPINREVAAVILEDAGLNVTLASSGPEALERLRQQRFDLVIMDIQMPGMDGLTTTRRIREMPDGASLPIIAMTANAFAEDETECLNAGMNAFVPKPIEPERLYRTVLACLDKLPLKARPL